MLFSFNIKKYFREMNSFEEIIITIKNPGEKPILNYEYNFPPYEIQVNGVK